MKRRLEINPRSTVLPFQYVAYYEKEVYTAEAAGNLNDGQVASAYK